MHDKLPCNCHWHTFPFCVQRCWNRKAEIYASAVSSTLLYMQYLWWHVVLCVWMCNTCLCFACAPCRVTAWYTSAVWICVLCWHIARGVGLPYLQWVVAWAIDTTMECVMLMLNLDELSPLDTCKIKHSHCMIKHSHDTAVLWLKVSQNKVGLLCRYN